MYSSSKSAPTRITGAAAHSFDQSAGFAPAGFGYPAGPTVTLIKPQAGAALKRWIGRRWDLAAVLALMGSSAAYGGYALMHLG